MKTLYESLLGDMENTLNNGDNIMRKSIFGDIPNLKDFKKPNKYNCVLLWYCPGLVQNYVNKYSEFNFDNYRAGNYDNWTGLRFTIKKSFMKGAHCIDLHLSGLREGEQFDRYKQPKYLLMYELFTNTTVSQCKKIVMQMIKAIENNMDLLDEILKCSIDKSNHKSLTEILRL